MDIQNKVALVTGSAHRIGRTLALDLAAQGCHVVVHYHRSAGAAQKTVAKIESYGVNVWSLAVDLSDEAAVERIISWVWERAGRLDILINNAAIFPQERFLTTESKSWDRNMMINLKAPFLLSQAFARHLPAGRPGKIINLLDTVAMRPRNHHFAYTISKYGLEGLTKGMAHALADQHIQVNGLALGTILAGEDDGAVFEKVAAKTPARRSGSPQDVVRAMNYLLAAEYTTGEIIRVDGGMHLI